MGASQCCIRIQILQGKDIELDAVGRQFEPYLTTECVCMLVATLWCDLGCCSRTVVVQLQVIKLRPPTRSHDYASFESIFLHGRCENQIQQLEKGMINAPIHFLTGT